MESSQLYGGAEECHSSESGWTMYLGSSIHSDDDNHVQHSYADYEDADDNANVGGNGKSYHQDGDSDDSMASDASSGPSHQGLAPFKGQQDKLDHDEQDGGGGKHCSQRKSNKQVDDDGRRRSYEKKEVGFKARKANNNNNNNASESGSKVRNSFWMGKMK